MEMKGHPMAPLPPRDLAKEQEELLRALRDQVDPSLQETLRFLRNATQPDEGDLPVITISCLGTAHA
jgi:hypothetical protein